MSTILKTLKKLEEEKSVLEKNNDLKGLVLQGGDSAGTAEEKTIRVKGKLWGGLILGGFVLGMGTYFLLDHFAKETAPLKTVSRSAPPPVSKTPPAAKAVFDHPTGVPLSHIRENSPYAEDSFFMQPDEWVEPDAPVVEPTPGESIAVANPARPSVDAAVEKIDSLIKSVRNETYSLSEEPASLSVQPETHIPGLKVKGIVFFGDKHPANHIYLATPTENNIKLKVNETEQRAILKAIMPNKAVFVYQGKRVELAMGE